ncbi:MAG: hypothetical protein DHS20C12_26870 [Pseudohongiella sp.]|nr:MAG: hypothetical protein DHS20C12_26870 [Pseudohongiella sp.]
MKKTITLAAGLSSLLLGNLLAAQPLNQGVTVLYNERVVEVESTLADASELWVKPDDLTRINDFVLKPEGACLDALCIPVLQDRDSDMYVTRQGQGWFNVTGLADKLQQAYVADYDESVWSFGVMPLERRSFFRAGEAPDFELADRDGNMVKLSDFRGKKVLLLTWASW